MTNRIRIGNRVATRFVDATNGTVSYSINGVTVLTLTVTELRSAVAEYDRVTAVVTQAPPPAPTTGEQPPDQGVDDPEDPPDSDPVIPDPEPPPEEPPPPDPPPTPPDPGETGPPQIPPSITGLPVMRLPADCTVTPIFATPPNGSTLTVTANADNYTVTTSNLTIDLAGYRIGQIFLSDGVSRVRITNGRVGTLVNRMQNSITNPVTVTDIIVDNVHFTGGLTVRDGGIALRVGRMFVANCTSQEATTATGLDGIQTCCIWLDPGSTDVLVQDCDFRTFGAEACMRFSSAVRTVVHNTLFWCSSQKHCYRVHGNNSTLGGTLVTDHWLSDFQLRNRGTMIATLPGNTGPQFDVVQHVTIKRGIITMLLDGQGGYNAPFMLNQTQWSDGRYPLQHFLMENVTINAGSNPLPFFENIARTVPVLDWTFRNNIFHQI